MQTRVFYLRDANKFPVACVASRVVDSENLKTPIIRYAISIHNPKDTFDRKRGREIAIGRLLKGKHIGWVHKQPGVKIEVLNEIARDPNIPQRVRDAAKLATLSSRNERGLSAEG